MRDIRPQSLLSLPWLPEAPDFRGDLHAALGTRDLLARLERLAALAAHRLDPLETMQVDRALHMLGAVQAAEFTRVRLAIVGSATLDHLAAGIRVAGLRRRMLVDVHVGGFAQYRREILEAESPLRDFAPQMVLFSIGARELTGGLPLSSDTSAAESRLEQSMGELRRLWEAARTRFQATVIQQTLLDLGEPLFGSLDRQVAGAPSRIVSRFNQRLSEIAGEDSVLLLDIARACERDGTDAWFDVARWLQAKMEIAPQAAPLYGDLVARLVAAQRGLSRKCLVLDLDNTLWGGVLGDDGLEGIVLGEGTGLGEAHLALQRYAKQLKDRGIVLAVCSKNDAATAEAAFREHPEMALRREDFAAFVANWSDKAENLKAIAAQLNLGLDSLVFVDDNPAERVRIRGALPAVAVPELPADAAHYVRYLAGAGYFEAVSFTPEDAQRAHQYAANIERDTYQKTAESLDGYLRGLEMTVTFGPFRSLDLARVTQLVNKTNQFNPTTRRYNAEEIAGFAASPEALTLQFRLLDRFGDSGLVSVMLLRPVADAPDILDIDTWVMSCRVFGRGLEMEAMNIAVEAARKRGVRALRADYVPTAKNGVVSNLYADLGFSRADDSLCTPGASRWTLDLDDYSPKPTHIGRGTAP